MKKFYVKDCPYNLSVHMWIKEQTDIQKYIDSMVPKNKGSLFELHDPSLDLRQLKQSTDQVFDKFGWYGFMNVFGDQTTRSNEYGGISLVSNPNYIYDIPEHAQTLGYPRTNLPADFLYLHVGLFTELVNKNLDKQFYNICLEQGTHLGFKFLLDQNGIDYITYKQLVETYPNKTQVSQRLIKNSYTDTWSFNKINQGAKHGYLANILKRTKRSVVRSRLAQMRNIHSDTHAKIINRFTWHRDDSWFYELRLNLSLDNIDNIFGIEIEDLGKTPFKPGHWYVWDTLIPHRPYVEKKVTNFARTNYVLAVNPWFDYDAEDDAWIQNEFYGEKHPVDMVLDSDVLENINYNSLQ